MNCDLPDVRGHGIETLTAFAEYSHHGTATSHANAPAGHRVPTWWIWHRCAVEPHTVDCHEVRSGVCVNSSVGLFDVFGKLHSEPCEIRSG